MIYPDMLMHCPDCNTFWRMRYTYDGEGPYGELIRTPVEEGEDECPVCHGPGRSYNTYPPEEEEQR